MKKQIFLMLCFLLLISTAFYSCKKNIDEKTLSQAAKQDAPFPENDVATIVMPNEVAASTITANRNDEKYNTFYGPQVQMGNGHVRSWINITHSGVPLAIGVEMTDGALSGLPTDPEDHMAATYILALHQKALAVTPFKHIMMNWNVLGHEPPHVYDVPHFDFHFYKVSHEEVMNTTDPAKFNIFPPAGFIPDLYFNPGGGVPMMGSHWIDLLSPEVQPPASPQHAAFTHTFIYGSYDGAVTFVEPMITLATLAGGSTVLKPYRQPLYFSPTGTNYPTRYCIWKDNSNDRHYVALDQMMMR